ncbi:hypothetical protein D3C76_419760 [compost metagenome]
MLAVEGDDRPHRDARGFHIDQQERNAALLTGLGVGAHQAEHPVGKVRQGGPGFLAVDHVVIALAHCAGFQRRQIRTGTRLGVALAPPVLTGKNSGKEVCFLLGGAELDDHWRDHFQAERHHLRCARGKAFLVENMLLHGTPAGTAELDRPPRREPALPVEDLHPLHLMRFAQAFAQRNPLGQFARQIVAQEGPDFLAKGLFLWGKFNVHPSTPKSIGAYPLPQGNCGVYSKTITERASSPRRSSSNASLIWSRRMRWEIISSSLSLPDM